jgi:hypothetical protein
MRFHREIPEVFPILPGYDRPGKESAMPGYSRIGLMGFVIAWLVIESCAWAQMPITRGKGDKAEGIDEGIIRDRNVEKFAAPRVPDLRVPAPAPFPQAQVFVGGVNGQQKSLTLEQPAPARAEDLDELDGPPEERPPQQPAMPLNLQNSALGRENFDRWLFGDEVGDVARREHLNSQVWKQVESISKKRGLTAAQESKLWLAGHGDIKRFFDRVEASRREFEVARKSFKVGFHFLSSLDPLCREYEVGPFGDDSLFAKTLRKIENDALAARPSGN